jgi:rRNA maturation endonuclease Nob1
MVEYMLLCRQCRHVFKSPVKPGPSSSGKMYCLLCPKCGRPDIVEAPVWAPLGSGMNIFDGTTWEYECQQCHNKFKMPVPKSPSEAKARKCSACGSDHLHLLTELGAQPLYCG